MDERQERLISGYKQLLKFFSSPDKWTQSTFARNKDGRATQVNSEDAVCWCIAGAVRKLNLDAGYGQDFDLKDSLVGDLAKAAGDPIAFFNDRETTTFHVMRTFLQQRLNDLRGIPNRFYFGHLYCPR